MNQPSAAMNSSGLGSANTPPFSVLMIGTPGASVGPEQAERGAEGGDHHDGGEADQRRAAGSASSRYPGTAVA